MNIAVIANDEGNAQRLCGMLGEFMTRYGEPYKADVYSDEEAYIRRDRAVYDAVYVEACGLPGMELAALKRVREHDGVVKIVLIADSARFALQGYEYDVFDYLVTPMEEASFGRHFDRLYVRLRQGGRPEVFIEERSRVTRLFVADIDYAETMGHKCVVHLGHRSVEIRCTMGELSKRLAPYGFCMCNQCYLVNLDRIRAVEGDMAVVGQARLKIARSRKKALCERLFSAYGGLPSARAAQ